jgi:hypothetical protein
VASFVSNSQEASARSALSQFIELAGMDADFLRPHLDLLIDTMLAIVINPELEEDTRHMAMEFIVSVAENRPGMVRKKELTIQRIIPILLEMIHDLEDNPDWNEGEEADLEDANSEVGSESLDRLSLALGGNAITPQLFQFIPQMLASPDWKQRHAAIMAISVSGEGCSSFLAPHLAKLVEYALKGLPAGGESPPPPPCFVTHLPWSCCCSGCCTVWYCHVWVMSILEFVGLPAMRLAKWPLTLAYVLACVVAVHQISNAAVLL